MKIEHIAIWVNDLERMKAFYEEFFRGKSGSQYHNPQKDFRSYFLSFDSGCRLELMHNPETPQNKNDVLMQHRGIIHMAISVGSKQQVDNLTEVLKARGHRVIAKPKTTGDGYYESVVLDPENNRIEITV